MYAAIVTKYHGPTNFKGSRYSATSQAGRIYLSADDALNSQANHEKAARTLAEKLKWSGSWRGGCLPDGRYAWVVDYGNSCTPEFVVEPAVRS